MLAATTCPIVSSPEACRVKAVRRSISARRTASSPPGTAGLTAAQSPTAGVSNRGGTTARCTACAANTVQMPRSTRAMRPGTLPGSPSCANSSSRA